VVDKDIVIGRVINVTGMIGVSAGIVLLAFGLVLLLFRRGFGFDIAYPQAGKLETWALFAGSQGGTVAPAGGNTCAPRSARLDLRPRGPTVGYGPPDNLSHWHRCRWRAKNGSPSVHPMRGDEIRALRRLQREQRASSHVFQSERGGPMTPKAFHALFGRIGQRAKMPFPVHPHMLRHGCGYALANAGHDTRALQAWLGHKNIQHTVRYTELAPDRFKNFWR
jgi:hypothetical protein